MCSKGYLGCPRGIGELTAINDELSAKTVERVNDTQELVMLNNFAKECNEYQYKKFVQDRVSDIASWCWVLEDLLKRIEEAIKSLQYEHNALRVVVQRIQKEIDEHCRDGSRPGAFCPLSDLVEDAIMEEYKFLCDNKRKFEKIIPDLETEIKALDKTKKRLVLDVHHKQQAIAVEESCVNIDDDSMKDEQRNRKNKRGSPLRRWEHRCMSLKNAGLRALRNAAIIRQQVRGARTHLSIAAQAYAARVDSALRRRLNSNKVKLQDLKWQREEALRDNKSLEEELSGTEQNLVETMHQERVIAARLLVRSRRPPGEVTKDDVGMKLREELGRLRSFSKQLRTNINNIRSLQNHLLNSVSRIDCCAEDLHHVICIDEERIRHRQGDVPECSCHQSVPPNPPSSVDSQKKRPKHNSGLTIIHEENEEDDDNDYPFKA